MAPQSRRNRSATADGPESSDTAASYTLPLTASRPALLEGGSDKTFRQLLVDLTTLEDHLATARAHLADFLDLTIRQYTIFVTVADQQAERDMTVSAIAEHLRISGPFITTETAALVTKGLLEKAPNPRDRRSTIVRVSTRGEALLDESVSELVRVNDAMFDALDPGDFRAFARIVASLVTSTSRTVAQLSTDPPRQRRR